jgi:hypothetical protein
VLQGQTASFTLAADAGSYLSTVTGSCDGTLTDNSYTTEPVIADCSVQAQFVPQNASTVELQASPNPARANQMVTFTTTVSGGDFGPVDGQVLASASSGESCIDVSPQVNGSESSFSCNIAFATLGPRTISASFSASATHLNGSSGPLEIRVVRLTDLSVSIDPGQTSVEPDAAVSYLVEVRNTGPDTAPASMVVLASDPPLVAASWDCTALGGASCPQNSGVGEFAGMPSLPVGGGLNVLQIGIAPTSLPEGLTVQASISANDQAPHHALDPDQSNNLAIDFSQSARVFADGFE